MYHARFKHTHYEAGFHWGQALKEQGISIHSQHTFQITKERKSFAQSCIPIYKNYYPEILEEIKGIADGQNSSFEDLCAFFTVLASRFGITIISSSAETANF